MENQIQPMMQQQRKLKSISAADIKAMDEAADEQREKNILRGKDRAIQLIQGGVKEIEKLFNRYHAAKQVPQWVLPRNETSGAIDLKKINVPIALQGCLQAEGLPSFFVDAQFIKDHGQKKEEE
jgi:hypothetical protein